jgi:hypothetical protein
MTSPAARSVHCTYLYHQSKVKKCMVSTAASYSGSTWFECGMEGCSRFYLEVPSIGRSRWCPDIVSRDHHHHHISVMELGHLLTRSGLTCPEVSSKVCHDSFHSGSSVSLPWVIYYEAFCLHVVLVSSFSCIPVICPNLVLYDNPAFKTSGSSRGGDTLTDTSVHFNSPFFEILV